MGKLLDKIRGLHKPGRPFCTAVVVAAGRSERMGQDKLLLPLGNRPVLEHTLRAVNAAERVDEIILVTREDLMMPLADLCKKCGLQKPVKVVRGGETGRNPCWQEPWRQIAGRNSLRCKTEPGR